MEGKPLTATTIGYTLAPRINASGRMGCATLAGELLLTDDPARAEELARELCALNRERQAIEGEIFAQCVELLDREGGGHPVIVLASEGWHQGVVGIVASRLTEKYSCPAFMICLQDGKGKGSCRSYGGFNLFAALEQCAGCWRTLAATSWLPASPSIRKISTPSAPGWRRRFWSAPAARRWSPSSR